MICSLDFDFHERQMTRLAFNWHNQGTGFWEPKPVWRNVQRINHSNQFVPRSVLLRTGEVNFFNEKLK